MDYKHTRTKLKIENEYPKLVRDKIPELVEKRTGKKPKIRMMESDKECERYLKTKVVEEADELKNAKGKIHLAEEMADILEIFDLLLELNKLTIKDVKKVQRQKAKERGGFGKKLLMLEKA